MSSPDPLKRRVDPWAVVEHHARQAAELAEGSMSEPARLALYVSAAPGVIGAIPVRPGELGAGRPNDGEEWWKVSLPGPTGSAGRWLVWNASGTMLLQRPAATGRRMLLASAGSGLLSLLGLAKVMGPRAIIPAVVIAGVAAFLTRLVAPSYTPLGTWPGDERYQKAVTGLVERYERDVGA